MYISRSSFSWGAKSSRTDDGLEGPDADTGSEHQGPHPAARVSSIVITLGIVSMLTDVSSESTAAVLPIYVTGALGLSTIAFGFIDGLYQGVSAVVRIAGGWAADAGDQPKWIAFLGYGLSALARIALLFATGFGALLAIVTADRLGKGLRTAPRDALIATASQPNNLARSFGVHRMLDTVGAAAGPLLAFLVLMVVPDGYHVVFMMSLAFAVVGVIVLGLLVPNLRPRAERARARTRRTTSTDASEDSESTQRRFSWKQLKDARLRRLLLISALLGLLTIGDGFVYLLLQSRDGFAAQWFPLLYVGTNVAFLALAIPIGRLADRVGRARVFVIGHLALLGAYLCAIAPSLGAVTTVACLVLLGAFYAATDGILAALAANCTPVDARATGIASAQTVVAVARLIASTGFGLLWFTVGPSSAVLIVSVGLAIVIPLVAMLVRGLSNPITDDSAVTVERS